MPCILYRVLQHTAAASHIEKPNTLSGRRVVHERQMRRATCWHNRGSNLVDYTFCVLILPCLYFSGDTRHEIQKSLNPLQCKEFRHKMTPPVLNNDKHLFKLGGVIHFGRGEQFRTLYPKILRRSRFENQAAKLRKVLHDKKNQMLFPPHRI